MDRTHHSQLSAVLLVAAMALLIAGPGCSEETADAGSDRADAITADTVTGGDTAFDIESDATRDTPGTADTGDSGDDTGDGGDDTVDPDAADGAGDDTDDAHPPHDAADDDGHTGDDTGSSCGPSPAGCRTTGCPTSFVCSTDPDDGCAPSSCSCDAATGTWACTSDCSGGVCVPSDPDGDCSTDGDCVFAEQICEEGHCENCPVDCDPLCERGYVPLIRNGCTMCSCVPSDGPCRTSADCPEDKACVDGRCRATDACDGPNPAGCTATGCPAGHRCDRSDVECAPSSCSCDADAGAWICTDDCGGGGVCVEDGGGSDCEADRECEAPKVCEGGECETIFCPEHCPGVCGEDGNTYCNACIARTHHVDVVSEGPCETEGECRRNADCEGDLICYPPDDRCREACSIRCLVADPVCGTDGRTYTCGAEDAWCHGVEVQHDGACSEGSACEGPNPAGCTATGCPDGLFCDRRDAGCAPSSCSCDASSGFWACTRDCGGGGTCRPVDE